MKFSNIAIIGAGLMLAKTIYKDYKDDKEKAEEEERRISSPVRFTDGINSDMFYEFAQNAKTHTPRLKDIDVAGMSVTLTIKSNTGLSKWQATIDFSDYGHLTGRYWIKSDDDQSIIPEHFAKLIQEQILEVLNR